MRHPACSRSTDEQDGDATPSRGRCRMTQPPIADYAIIGDCRSAALVSRHGSIDWLCLPRFDSASIFASILDTARGGRFLVTPTRPASVTRQYIGDSNVLETTFTTDTGVARLVDVMPVDTEQAKARELWPEHEVLRRVECIAGEVELQVEFEPRFDYGLHTAAHRPSRPGHFPLRAWRQRTHAEHGFRSRSRRQRQCDRHRAAPCW